MTLSEIGGSSLGGSEERRDFHPNLQLIPPTFSMSQAHPQAFMPYVQETFKNILKQGSQSLNPQAVGILINRNISKLAFFYAF